MYKCTTLTCQYTCKIFSRKKSNSKIFSRKKSNRDTVQKQNTNTLSCSRRFYLLSICSKKIDSSEFHKQIHDFELPIHWDFFWRAKWAGKHYQNVTPMTRILHAPFTCYHYVIHKFTALNYTNKFMTLTCPFISLFWNFNHIDVQGKRTVRRTSFAWIDCFNLKIRGVSVIWNEWIYFYCCWWCFFSFFFLSYFDFACCL